MHDYLQLLADTCNADLRNVSLAITASTSKKNGRSFAIIKAFQIYTNQMTAHQYNALYQQRGGWD